MILPFPNHWFGDLSMHFSRPDMQSLLQFGEGKNRGGKRIREDWVVVGHISACQTIFQLYSQNIQQHHPWCPAGSVAHPEMSLPEQCARHRKAAPSHCYTETGWIYPRKKPKKIVKLLYFSKYDSIDLKTNSKHLICLDPATQRYLYGTQTTRKNPKSSSFEIICTFVYFFLSHIQEG